MQGSFERFDPEALVRRRVGEAPRAGLAGLQPVPVERGRSIRFNRSVLSVLAGAGLAVMALGAFRSPELDSARPGGSIGDLTRDTGELPVPRSSTPTKRCARGRVRAITAAPAGGMRVEGKSGLRLPRSKSCKAISSRPIILATAVWAIFAAGIAYWTPPPGSGTQLATNADRPAPRTVARTVSGLEVHR